MARRPGRTQSIAYDTTPLNAPSPDLSARIGWLLAMSRLHHQDGSFQDGSRFAECLGTAGFAASRSALSRWEAGLVSISHEGMTAYERVLGLQPGKVTSVVGYLTAGPSQQRVRGSGPRLDPSSREFAVRLDELVDAAVAGTAPARDWQELGWHLAAAPLVYLPKGTWHALVERVVNLLPRSVNVAYRQLSTAAMTMATIPRAQDFMVEAIATYISHPDVQVVGNPLVMLDHLPTRRAARLVLDVLARPESSVAYGVGVWLARQKMVRGDLTEEEIAELQMIVLRTWRSDASLASEHLAELITDLPDGMRAALIEAAVKAGRPKLGYVIEHGEDVPAPKALAFSRTLADAARAGAPQEATYDEDRMLARLVREALFHRDSDRRHTAAMLIAASPFASPMADALLLRLSDGDPEWLRGRLATLLRYVCDDHHRRRMGPLVSDRTERVGIAVSQGLGHLPFSRTSDLEVRESLDPQWSARERAKLYMLGMTASPALVPMSRSQAAPTWQRSAARWWLELGPAVSS